VRNIVIVIGVVGLMFGQIMKIETDYKDSTVIRVFHDNGKLKLKGVKVDKFREGKWKYYDEKGRLFKVELYDFGRRVNTMELGDSK